VARWLGGVRLIESTLAARFETRQPLTMSWSKQDTDAKGNKFMGLTLRVKDEDRARISQFYVSQFGFQRLSSASLPEEVLALPLVHSEVSFPFVHLRFVTAKEGNAKTAEVVKAKSEAYSKTGFFMHDADAAAAFLKTSPPEQFFEIAYLTHGADPLGLSYELLQTTQESNEEERQKLWDDNKRAKYPEEISGFVSRGELGSSVERSMLGTQPLVFGLITLRVPESERTLDFYQNVMGMRLLSAMPIPQLGFTLFFLGYSDEEPPNTKDLAAFENREWTWQMKLTTLELLCRDGMKLTYNGLEDWREDEERRVEGFDSFQFLVGEEEKLEKLRKYPGFVASTEPGHPSAEADHPPGGVGNPSGVRKFGKVRDPNNILLEVYTSTA